MARERILVVDDDEDIRDLLSDRLESMGYRVLVAEDGKEGLTAIRRQSPDLVFMDIQMPRMNGFDVLEKLKEEQLDTTVIVITAHGNVETAVKSMRLGAYDFIEKPFDTGRIEVVVEKALRQVHLQREHEVLQDVLSERDPTVIGESASMAAVFSTAERAAGSDATVLLLGESGTGKEVLARAIHEWSDRKSGPFVAVNCAALPDQLLESSLFGHEKGSFTGATALKKGKFEVARGGTILLDEIGDLKQELQAKLLRVLQDGEFERVGGTDPLQADVRILAATNRNLEEAMKEGTFREDLYYRLNVVSITLPPLRQRKDDVPLLAQHFVEQYGKDTKRTFNGISPEALASLTRYSWPGNIRELANTIERAVVLGPGPLIELDDLPDRVRSGEVSGAMPAPSDLPYHQAVEESKRAIIVNALNRTGGNQSKAAEFLGLQRTYLARLITNLGLRERNEDTGTNQSE